MILRLVAVCPTAALPFIASRKLAPDVDLDGPQHCPRSADFRRLKFCGALCYPHRVLSMHDNPEYISSGASTVALWAIFLKDVPTDEIKLASIR